MDRPFREIHELYRIVFLRAKEQEEKEKQRQEEEEKERQAKDQSDIRRGAIHPHIRREPPSDAATVKKDKSLTPSSQLEIEALEDAFEELAEGGV